MQMYNFFPIALADRRGFRSVFYCRYTYYQHQQCFLQSVWNCQSVRSMFNTKLICSQTQPSAVVNLSVSCRVVLRHRVALTRPRHVPLLFRFSDASTFAQTTNTVPCAISGLAKVGCFRFSKKNVKSEKVRNFVFLEFLNFHNFFLSLP